MDGRGRSGYDRGVNRTSSAGRAARPVVDDRLLGEVVRRVRQVGDPERIVLFGSLARGDAGSSSDLDILILEESDLPRHRRAAKYRRALLGLYPAKDIVVWTPAEVAAWRDVPNAFVTTALAEGRTLYDRAAQAR